MILSFRGKELNKENINLFFQKITTYDELKKFEEDYFNVVKQSPHIVPKRNQLDQYVNNITKVDDNTITFWVISDAPRQPSHKRKSSIKMFVKNYIVFLW